MIFDRRPQYKFCGRLASRTAVAVTVPVPSSNHVNLHVSNENRHVPRYVVRNRLLQLALLMWTVRQQAERSCEVNLRTEVRSLRDRDKILLGSHSCKCKSLIKRSSRMSSVCLSRVRSQKLSEIGAKFRRKSGSPSKNMTSDCAPEVAKSPKVAHFGSVQATYCFAPLVIQLSCIS